MITRNPDSTWIWSFSVGSSRARPQEGPPQPLPAMYTRTAGFSPCPCRDSISFSRALCVISIMTFSSFGVHMESLPLGLRSARESYRFFAEGDALRERGVCSAEPTCCPAAIAGVGGARPFEGGVSPGGASSDRAVFLRPVSRRPALCTMVGAPRGKVQRSIPLPKVEKTPPRPEHRGMLTRMLCPRPDDAL
jgi:hypothetical protein